jgi:tetratricopeptide (TPR) repeat protein
MRKLEDELRRTYPLRGAGLVMFMWLCLPHTAAAQSLPPPPEPEAIKTEGASDAMARSTTKDEDMVDLQARSHFRLGREYYTLGRFRDAAREFEAAYGLSGRAALLYNVYISYREAQDTPKASGALRGYLAAVPDAPDRDNLSARLQALEAQVAQSRADAERAQAQREELERLRGEAEARAREASAAQQPATSPPPSAAASRPWWPWLVVGAGVVAAATGVTLGGLASSDASGLRAQCVADPRTDGASAPLVSGQSCAPSVELEARRDAIQSQALAGDVLWIGGATLVLTGLVLAVVLPPTERTPDPPLRAACGPGACQAALHLRF